MDPEELKTRLFQIEEQASLALAEFPSLITKDRQRLIIAMVRRLRTSMEETRWAAVHSDPEATLPGPRP